MKTSGILMSLLLLGLQTRQGKAVEIAQPLISGNLNITEFGPIGQTFTAEDSHLSSIGFFVENVNQIVIDAPPPGPATFTYTLFKGIGPAALFGTAVASSKVIEPKGFEGYADAYFSGVTLNIGQQYTVLVNSSSVDTLLSRHQIAPTAQPTPTVGDYTGGEMFYEGQIQPLEDATFRIEGVPDTGSFWLYPIAAGFLFLARKRFRQNKQAAGAE